MNFMLILNHNSDFCGSEKGKKMEPFNYKSMCIFVHTRMHERKDKKIIFLIFNPRGNVLTNCTIGIAILTVISHIRGGAND